MGTHCDCCCRFCSVSHYPFTVVCGHCKPDILQPRCSGGLFPWLLLNPCACRGSVRYSLINAARYRLRMDYRWLEHGLLPAVVRTPVRVNRPDPARRYCTFVPRRNLRRLDVTNAFTRFFLIILII